MRIKDSSWFYTEEGRWGSTFKAWTDIHFDQLLYFEYSFDDVFLLPQLILNRNKTTFK